MTACTSGCLSCELWIEIESVVRSPRCWLERRVDFSAVQLLQREEIRGTSEGRGNTLTDRIITKDDSAVVRADTDIPVDGAEEMMPLDLLHSIRPSS